VEYVLTDALSRMDKTGDYALKTDVYSHAVATLQVRPTIDLFANVHNAKCTHFIALPGRLGNEAVARDAFSLRSWSNPGLPYLFPPIAIIGRVLHRLWTENVVAVVVIPQWPSHPWWGLVKQMAVATMELGKEKDVLVPGPLMCSSETEKKLPPGLFLMAVMNPTITKSTVGKW
jgi:hypothetical protein